jgi:hypothetical protein
MRMDRRTDITRLRFAPKVCHSHLKTQHCILLDLNINLTVDSRIKLAQVSVAAPGKYEIRNTRHALLARLTVIYRYCRASLQLQAVAWQQES